MAKAKYDRENQSKLKCIKHNIVIVKSALFIIFMDKNMLMKFNRKKIAHLHEVNFMYMHFLFA